MHSLTQMSSNLPRAWVGQQLSKLTLSGHTELVAQFQTTFRTAAASFNTMTRDFTRSGAIHGRQLGSKVNPTETGFSCASSTAGRVSICDSSVRSRLLLKSRVTACRMLRTSPKTTREGFSRNYNTSRSLRAQPELSENDLAHIAAQRRTYSIFCIDIFIKQMHGSIKTDLLSRGGSCVLSWSTPTDDVHHFRNCICMDLC